MHFLYFFHLTSTWGYCLSESGKGVSFFRKRKLELKGAHNEALFQCCRNTTISRVEQITFQPKKTRKTEMYQESKTALLPVIHYLTCFIVLKMTLVIIKIAQINLLNRIPTWNTWGLFRQIVHRNTNHRI